MLEPREHLVHCITISEVDTATAAMIKAAAAGNQNRFIWKYLTINTFSIHQSGHSSHNQSQRATAKLAVAKKPNNPQLHPM
jgi:hypothetical protein